MHKREIQEGDKAVAYIFRNLVVIELQIEFKRMKFGDEANMCNFIEEDYDLIIDFVKQCKEFIAGRIEEKDLYNIIVN
jgi:hypothetical protein